MLLLLKVVLVAVTTTVGKASAAFAEGVVVPAWDALQAEASVWQVHTVPWEEGAGTGVNEFTGPPQTIPRLHRAAAGHPSGCLILGTVGLSVGLGGPRNIWPI